MFIVNVKSYLPRKFGLPNLHALSRKNVQSKDRISAILKISVKAYKNSTISKQKRRKQKQVSENDEQPRWRAHPVILGQQDNGARTLAPKTCRRIAEVILRRVWMELWDRVV